MFRKTNKLPQRKEFNLSLDEIVEDVCNVSNDSMQRVKLYKCIDHKVPRHEHQFTKIEDFLKGTDSLEASAFSLADLCDQLNVLEKQLNSGTSLISDMAKETLSN